MRALSALIGLVSATVTVAESAAQMSLPGVVHLDAQSVVVSIFPDELDGVHLEARISHKKHWVDYSARFDPEVVKKWVAEVEPFARSESSGSSNLSPVLTSLNHSRGVGLQFDDKDGKRRIYWLLHRLDQQEPLVIRADPHFSDTLLTSLGVAARLSAIDSAAFASGLVAPLTDPPDSLNPWPLSVPQPLYPVSLGNAGIDGLVQVRYIIGPDGRVPIETLEVLWASRPDFVPSVQLALTQGRFRPARWSGRPARARVYQTIRFKVHGERPRWN